MTGGEGKVGWAMVVKGKDEEELWRRGGGGRVCACKADLARQVR